MGVVYLGRDHDTGAAAAVKLIRAEHAANPVLRARLGREVAAARRVPRFCTAPVLGADLDADQPWVATEYIDGPTLDTALLEGGRLTGTTLEVFAVGVAVALQAIHRQGVVHRDLKPSNILLSPFGPRVIDFGIAQIDDAHTQLTRTGAIVGTPAYMAPEQLRGDPITTAVDVFAWASVVAFAATGRPPFGTGDVPLRSVLHEPPDLGELAGPLRDLVTAAFAKDPTARPSTTELVEQLSGMAPAVTTQVLATAAAAPAAPTGGPAPQRPPARPRRRRWTLVAAAATVLAVAVAAGAVALVRGDDAAAQRQDEVRSRQLAAQAREADLIDPRSSMELALDAWAAAPTPEARSVLLGAYTHAYAGRLGTEPGGQSIAVNPAGTMVAVGHPDGTVRLWDVATRQPVGEPLTAHGDAVHRVQFSPDGALLATSSVEPGDDRWPDSVRVWEVASGQLRHALPGWNQVVWLPDGSSLIAPTLRPDGAGDPTWVFAIWDAATGQELATIPDVGPMISVAVSPDGAWVAGGRDDGTAGVWRVDDHRSVAEVSGYADDSLVSVAFTAAGELATVGEDGVVRIWPLPDADQPRLLDDGELRTVGRLAASSDGFLLATGAGMPLEWWETEVGWQSGRLIGFEGTPLDVAVSADGKLVAAAGLDGVTTLWQRATFFLPHPDGLYGVAYAPAGDRLATSGMDGVVRIWDTATNTVTDTITHGDETRSVAYAPDGTLVSTSLDGTVLLHGPDGEQRAELAVGGGLEAHDAAFSADGGLLAVTAADDSGTATRYQIHVWETGQFQLRGVIDAGDDFPTALAFTPDGSQLLATVYTSLSVTGDAPERSELRGWRTADLTEVDSADLGEQQAVHLAVSPDGRTLAVAGTDRNVALRDLTGGRATRTIADHPSTVRQVAFSPDGETLATITTGDEVIRLWDIATGERLASLTGHGDTPNAIAFAPDGRTLASASPDGFAGLWVTDPDDAVARICQALGGAEGDPAPHQLCVPAGGD
jgi:WD40 repeat protein